MSVRRRLTVIGAALAIIATAGALSLKPVALERTSPLIPAPIHYLTGTYSATYDFVTPSHGWALVTDYGGAFPEFFIFQTTDGAAHWRKQYSAEARQVGPYLQFEDQRNGVLLYGGAAFTTVDGGDHWTEVPKPRTGFFLSVTGAGDDWAEFFDYDQPHLYRTLNGGKTWTRIGADPPESAVVVAMDDVLHRAAIGKNGEGWLGAQDQTDPVVFHTSDGGDSWQAISILFPFGPGDGSFLFTTTVRLLDDSTVLAFVEGDGGITEAWLSRDHGASWDTTSFPRVGAVTETDFVDANHWWLFEGSSVYTTDDRGRSWLYVHDAGFPDGWNPGQGRAIDRMHAWWALTSTANSEVSALLMTADGGMHWKLVNAPPP